MELVKIFRTYYDWGTVGRLEMPDGVQLYTIERPNLGNKPRVSCIPEGRYKVIKSTFFTGKSKGKRAFRLKDVPNRSGILIHLGNYPRDVVGCIAPNLSVNVRAKRGYNSSRAFEYMWEHLGQSFELLILEEQNEELRWKDTPRVLLSGNSPIVGIPKSPNKKKGGNSNFFLLLFFLSLVVSRRV